MGAEEKFDAIKDQVTGKVKEEFGKATGDAKKEAEGKVAAAQGKLKEGAENLKDGVKDLFDK